MMKPTFKAKNLVMLLLLTGFQNFAQNYVPFTPRFNQDLKGDIVLIGNNILGPDNNAFNDTTVYNHTVDMKYIDIDGDASTFSSSSADLVIDNPNCYNIVHAGLYWGAVNKGSQPITNVKLKGPTGGYIDVIGTVVFDANSTSVDGGNSFPYACYADVTSIVTGLTNNLGTYTIANVSSGEGQTNTYSPYNGTGHSAGWSLFIVYEDPTLPGKSITSFDGFSAISVPGGNPALDIPVSGFRTVPAPTPVRANFAFATLEGDSPILGDQLLLNGLNLSTVDRSATNFFNSSVTQLSATPVNNRNPNSANTLGFDTGVMVVPNPGNTVIANNDTSATVRLETSGDTYFPYFFALAVDIIEPRIVLTKVVEDVSGNNIGGQQVSLGDELNYVIGFQNTGNDDTTNLTIKDVLPINIVFNYPEDIIDLPSGVTVQSYNQVTREIIFEVGNSVVEVNDPMQEIRFKVTVVQTCSLLNDACDNIINNQAYATYNGTLNPTFTISDDPSFNSNTGCLITPGATNFLADIDCDFTEEVILCGDSTVLTAGDGYDSYTWSTSPSGSPIIGTSQTLTVTTPGTYYVHNAATAPCQSIDQIFNVITFGAGVTNPLIPFADQVVTCPNDGKKLPNFYLCGTNDTRFIQTNITDATSIVWEKLDETSCPAMTVDDCANENNTCTWNQVTNGADFLIDTAGQYRLTLNYTGGCFNRFYFNVYTNLLQPTVTSRDIICTTPGQITVGGVPSGYEYSIDGVNYQGSNVFTVNVPDIYSVYVRQVGVSPNPCIFTVPDVQIRQRDFTVSTIVTQPYCNGGLGSISVAANDVRPQYSFSIFEGATQVNSVGPLTENNYTFNNLNPGTYTFNVSTEDGCTYTGNVEIIEPPLLTVTAALTQPLTCTDGEITIYPVGGTPPYFYFVNSTTVFQVTPTINVPAAGNYNIRVVDSNNCEATTSITVDGILPPEFTIEQTNILCADAPNSGSISINVTNANGNSLMYSIDGGTTFASSPVFTGLSAGDYDVVVQYTFDGDICATVAQSVTITAQAPITGTATLTTPLTCTTSGVITVSGVSGGTPPYQYSIDGVNFQSGNTFSGLSNGTYTVTVLDANGCSSALAPITIDALDPPTDMDFSSTALTCPTNTSDVTITGTTGGTSPLEYQIIAPSGSATAYQSSNVFSGLAPGTYTFQVRDANDCTYSESYTIDPLPVVSVVGQALSNITCFGALDGTARFTVSGTTSFTYTINGGSATAGASPINLTGLAVGSYTIAVTDTTTNCTATDTVTISGPPSALSVTATASPLTCTADGSVAISATGGWGGYSYELEQPDSTVLGPQGSNSFGGLSQTGTYTVTVTDANGCEATTTFALSTPSNPTATISSADYCYDATNGASLEVSASGGNPPYEYSINGSAFQSNNVFTNLVPGTYDITVRDAYGCTYTVPTETIADQLTATANLTKGLDCTASPDATINVTVSGGTAPYTYEVSIDGGAFTATGNPPYSYNSAQTGDYQYRITDAQGCTALTNVVTIQPITTPAATAIATDVFCNGDTSGIATIDIDETVGTPPYEVSFNSSGFTSQTVYNGLVAGTYNFIVRDANSCAFNGSVTVNEPAPMVPNIVMNPIQCNVNTPGSFDVSVVSGGIAPYTYSLLDDSYALIATYTESASATTPVHNFGGLTFGDYYISIVDANGCEYQSRLRIETPPYLKVTGYVDTSNCATGVDYTVETTGGTGPYRYSIFGQPSTETSPLGSATYTFTGLTHGVTYFLQVKDAFDCISVLEATMPPPPSGIEITGTTITNVDCSGNSSGVLAYTVQNYDATVTDIHYEVLDALTLNPITTPINGALTGPAGGPTSGNITNLPAGNYVLTVREETGTLCSNAFTFEITEPIQPVTASITTNVSANCNQNAQVAVNASGGTPPYEYAFVVDGALPGAGDWTSSNLAFLDPTVNTNWDVYVRDANGCNIAIPLDVMIATDPTPSVTLPTLADDQCSSNDGTYTFTATPGGGEITPVTYSIDGVNFQSSATFTVSAPGNYTVTIRDGNGCIATDTIEVYPPLNLTPTVTALPTCPDNDGEITVTGYGGSGNYTYSISPNVGSLSGNVFSGVPSGTYTITIEDTTTGCTTPANITLDPATPVTFTTSVTGVSCNGGSDGTITVNLGAGNDNPPYTYEIIAPIIVASQTSNIFTGLPANTYTVQVNSGRGCSTTEDVTVGEPLTLSVSGTVTDFACAPDNSVNTALLTITEADGTAPYTYSIDGVNYFTSNTFDIIDTGSVQNIDIYVKDNNGCIASDSVVVNPLPSLTAASVATATPIDCNNAGTVTISVTGGSGNFSYQMLPDGTPQPSNTFSITAPGDYYFQVNDLDTGCNIATTVFTVAPYDTIEVVATPTMAVTCFGDTNGVFELNITGFTGAYTYEVFNSSGTSVIGVTTANTSTNPLVVSGLMGGSYYVEVVETDSPYCSATSNTFTIDSPSEALMLSASETSNVTCDNNQGTITAIANGGWGNYEYELTGTVSVPYSTSGTFTNLPAGTYTVNVRDSGNCVVSEGITLAEPNPIDAAIAATPTLLDCFGDTGATITVSNVTGGQGSNYSYTLNMTAPTVSSSGPQMSNVFTGLGAGTYNVTVTDGYNCEFTTADVTINEPTQIMASLVAVTTPTCTTDATLTLSATGGTGTYEYSDTDTFTAVLGTFATDITFSVAPGTYQYYVRDANGCIASVSNGIAIEPLVPLTVDLDTTNATVNCAGDSTGVIVAEAQGGLGNYVYTLQDEFGNDIDPVTQDSPGVFTGLPIGTYQVYVESGDCEVTSATVTITEPTAPLVAQYTVTDITCNGENDGIIEVTASGGTGIIKYAITPRLDQFFDAPIFDELAPGLYDIIVQDELGCYVLLEDIEIIEAAPVMLSIVPNSILPEVCE
ncbi:SprB repeat-containing protein, partial [Aestuariivivens insulae]|uniref:SprB repeat-containing protein n=1 Tax=Aestuariivivens insulae TaxID=1621988 RepID=UPI001F568D1F